MRLAAASLWCVLLFFPYRLLAQTELQKAVGEFKAQTRDLGLRPDSPSKQGAAKSAAPQWHGRVYENFRNDFIDAIPHEIAQRGGAKSVLRRNQFGFNVSGPLVIPKLYDGGGKTFFSLTYEGVRDRTARSFLQTLATGPERGGNFSGTVDQAGEPLLIYDPLTTRPNPGFDPGRPVTRENLEYFRAPFPNNRIDTDRLAPVALNALRYYPSPNASAGPFARNNYFLVTPQTNNAGGIIAKVDHTLRTRHRISINFNYTNGFNGSAALLPTAANPASPDRQYSEPWGSIEYVFTKSPQTVNTLRFHADSETSTAGEQGQPDYAGKLGLRGSSSLAFPVFSMSPYVSMGRSYPQSKNTWTYYNWSDGLSNQHGKHSLTLSGNHSLTQVNSFQPAYPAGSIRFDEGLTSLPGIVGTGHGFASFLLGLGGYAEKSYVLSPSYFRNSSDYATLREQYQAQKGLTVTLVLGFSHSSPRVEKYDRQSTVDLSVINPANSRPGAMIVAGLNGTGRSFQPHYVKLEPSASLAWNPFGDSETVVRASYSRYYGSSGISSTFGTQAFNAAPVYLSSNSQLEPAVRLSDGLPPLDRPLPDLRPDALNNTNADLVYRGHVQPAYQSASLSVERQFPFATLLTAGASHNDGKDIYVGNGVANFNAIPLTALAYRDQLNDEGFNRSLRPYPHYKSLNVGGMYPLGRYRQESGYVSVEKRATEGLSLTFRYNWTKRWDDYSGGRQDDVTLADLAKRALNERIAQLPSNALTGLLSAQNGLRVLVDPTADRAALQTAVDALPVSGKAGLLETIQTAAALGDAILAKAGVRLAVLFITDSDVGNYREDFTNPTINWTDSGDISRRFRDGLIRERISGLSASLETVETPVFILHLAYRTDTLNQAYQTGLMTLAATTGGSSYFCRSQAEIPDAMDKAFEAITSQYSLTVALPKALPSGGCHAGKSGPHAELARPV